MGKKLFQILKINQTNSSIKKTCKGNRKFWTENVL